VLDFHLHSLPLCFYQHYTVQVNFNSLEQCSNTRVALPSGVTGLGQWPAGLARFSPVHMGRTGSGPNLNLLTWVRPKPKCIEPGELIHGLLFYLCEPCLLNRVRPKKI
jgi:hypothetical protein